MAEHWLRPVVPILQRHDAQPRWGLSEQISQTLTIRNSSHTKIIKIIKISIQGRPLTFPFDVDVNFIFRVLIYFHRYLKLCPVGDADSLPLVWAEDEPEVMHGPQCVCKGVRVRCVCVCVRACGLNTLKMRANSYMGNTLHIQSS